MAGCAGCGMDELLSRPTSSVWGKATETVKCLVPFEVKEAFTQKVRSMGYPSESDAMRELIICFTFGSDHLVKVHADRIRKMSESMSGIGTGAGGS
jgi:hypothetical protein